MLQLKAEFKAAAKIKNKINNNKNSVSALRIVYFCKKYGIF